MNNYKQIAGKLVNDNLPELMQMTTCKELFDFASNNGLSSNGFAFNAFKNALLEVGINYNEMRASELNARKERVTHVLKVYSDANFKNNRFAITNSEGFPFYYGNFYMPQNSQAEAELTAAKKAVYLARQVSKRLKEVKGNHCQLKLSLIVDAEWLTYQSNRKQKGYILTEMANRSDIVLAVGWIPGDENPAHQYTEGKGYVSVDEEIIEQIINFELYELNRNEEVGSQPLSHQQET